MLADRTMFAIVRVGKGMKTWSVRPSRNFLRSVAVIAARVMMAMTVACVRVAAIRTGGSVAVFVLIDPRVQTLAGQRNGAVANQQGPSCEESNHRT
jgi:hypothetical protein